jgi:hypothetical protein
MPSWDRQPGESEVAYEAFKAFLMLEGKRSVREAGRRLSKTQGTLHKWYTKFHWRDRVRDYDNNKEKELLKADIESEKKRRRQLIEQKHKIGAHVQNLAIKALTKLTERLEQDECFVLFSNAIIGLMELGFKLQEADYPNHVEEQSGRKGIFALAESIKSLAEKTVERHDRGQQNKREAE